MKLIIIGFNSQGKYFHQWRRVYFGFKGVKMIVNNKQARTKDSDLSSDKTIKLVHFFDVAFACYYILPQIPQRKMYHFHFALNCPEVSHTSSYMTKLVKTNHS